MTSGDARPLCITRVTVAEWGLVFAGTVHNCSDCKNTLVHNLRVNSLFSHRLVRRCQHLIRTTIAKNSHAFEMKPAAFRVIIWCNLLLDWNGANMMITTWFDDDPLFNRYYPYDSAYRYYFDHEWSLPTDQDTHLFEFLSLGGFAAGLSWSGVLKKRRHWPPLLVTGKSTSLRLMMRHISRSYSLIHNSSATDAKLWRLSTMHSWSTKFNKRAPSPTISGNYWTTSNWS